MMKKFCVSIFVLLAVAVSAAEPLLKVGIVTDTHVTNDKASCRLVKASAEIFRDHNVDLLVNCGDIADFYYELGYKHYRDTLNEVFAKSPKKPQEIFVYANHDRLNRTKEDMFKVFADVKKHLQIPHDPYAVIKLKGYTFVVVPQYMDIKRYEKMVDKACKENPGKPVFVIDHVPAFGTTRLRSGDVARRNMLNKYPQVIHITGHSHGTLTNELQIWQGNFTAVNTGCLYRWYGHLVGGPAPGFDSDMAMLMEVYKDKIIFRRFFSGSKKEYHANEPWCIPLPFDQKNAPYTIDKRTASSKAPRFTSKAKIQVKVNGKNVNIRFPMARHKDGVYYYKVELMRQENNQWTTFARRDVYGQYMLEADKRKKNLSCPISIGFFEAGKNYRVSVKPVHFFGKEGNPLTAEFTVKSKPEVTVVYDNMDPMKNLSMISGLYGNDGEIYTPNADGFYHIKHEQVRMFLPESMWKHAKGTHFRFILEMHTVCPLSRTVTLRRTDIKSNARLPQLTAEGDTGNMRYVIEFKHKDSKHRFNLLLRGAVPAKIKINRIRLEIIK